MRVAVFSARRLLLKSSAPVSASHRLDVLIGLQRTPLTPDLAWRPERSDVDYSGRQVQDRVVECLGKGGAEFAFAVFVAGWKAEEIAEANGESKTEAQRVMRTTYNMLAADKHLHTMWREL